jgi:hypothetical protein
MPDNKRKTTVWEMTVDQAEMFFQAAMDLDLNTEVERLALLDWMKSTGHMTRVYETGRTKEQVIKDISKHYRAVRVEGKKGAAK